MLSLGRKASYLHLACSHILQGKQLCWEKERVTLAALWVAVCQLDWPLLWILNPYFKWPVMICRAVYKKQLERVSEALG
jgi:hypothetical protein